MEFLSRTLLESPLRLGVLSFAAFAVVLLWRRRWTGWGSRYGLPLTLAGIAALFVVQSLVVTERERLMEAFQAVVAAVESADARGLASRLSRDYASDDLDRDGVLELIEGLWRHIRVRDTRPMSVEVRIEDSSAEMKLAVRATVSVRGAVGEPHWGRWRISWRREGDVWRITALTPEVIDNLPVRSLRELRAYAP